MSQINNSEIENKKASIYYLPVIVFYLFITALYGIPSASAQPFFSKLQNPSGDSIVTPINPQIGKQLQITDKILFEKKPDHQNDLKSTKASASATYTSGHIETDLGFQWVSQSSSCPGQLTVTIPVGAVITSVDVEYVMEAFSGVSINEQRSQLRCTSPGGTSEMSLSSGIGGGTGTYAYNRTGLNIANGVSGGGNILFELHAGRTSNGIGCADNKQRVNNNSWKVTVYYSSDPIPNFTTNPTSVVVWQPVIFTNSSTGPITTYNWDFGVGAIPATANTAGPHQVVYSSDGPKTVSLTVNGSFTETKTFVVNVGDPVMSVSATYTSGNISTDGTFISLPGASRCPGSLTVSIPLGAVISSVDVEYSMLALNQGWMSEQRSQLRCVSTGGTSEISLTAGTENLPGTINYSRTGLDIANNVLGGGDVEFELHAGRTWPSWATSCNTTYNRVVNNTWTVTVFYSFNPVANFYADNTFAYLGQTVNFTDISIGAATSWDWDFGTGSSPPNAATQGPHAVTYGASGFKDVSLTINSAYNETKNDYIFVSDPNDWLKWDDNVNASRIGGVTYTWQSAVRFEPADFSSYGNSQISMIRIFVGDLPAGATLKIWQGSSQLTLVEYVSQVFTPIANQWNLIILNQPYTINTSQELWFGVEWDNPSSTVFPAGADASVSQTGKSDLYRTDLTNPNAWGTLLSLSINRDWNHQAYIVPAGSWTGTVSSQWEDPNNWFSTSVPSVGTDVNIPISPNDPVIRSNVEINSLSIESGASLTVLPDVGLKVIGDVENDAGISGLIIQSDASGTGSFISTTTGVQGTFQRYVKGEPEAWHGFSSPMVAQEISGDFTPSGTYGDGTGYDFYTWYEPDTSWIYILNNSFPPTWGDANGSNFFLQGKGYLASYQAENPILNYEGTFAAGSISIPITLTTGIGDQFGSNLVGNPYSSSIDWKATSGWTRDALDLSGGGYNIWVWNDTAYNYGVYNSASTSDVGTLGVTRHIPPTQGFFVLAAQSGNFVMTDEIRVNNGASNWLKSKGEKPNLFFLSVVSQDGFGDDEVMLEMNQDETKKGAYKRFSFIPSAPSLWIPHSGEYFSSLMIDSLTQYPVLPVSFNAGRSGTYQIKSEFYQEDIQTALLIDKQTGLAHDLLAEPEISFLASESDNPGRFILQFESGNYPDPHDQLPVRVFTYDHTLFIDLRLVDSPCRIEMYNMAGVKTFDDNNDGGIQYEILFPDLQGAFVVKVTGATGQKTQKVIF